MSNKKDLIQANMENVTKAINRAGYDWGPPEETNEDPKKKIEEKVEKKAEKEVTKVTEKIKVTKKDANLVRSFLELADSNRKSESLRYNPIVENKTKRINLVIKPTVMEKIKQQADERERSTNDWINALLETAIVEATTSE